MGRKIEPTELEELTMMPKAPKVACFRQDRHRVDRADARQLPQAQVVRLVREQRVRMCFDLMALPYQAASLGENQAEHVDRGRSSATGTRPSCRRSHRYRREDGLLTTFLPTTSQAASTKSSFENAVTLAGVGKCSRKARNQSLRELPAKRAISGKYSGR